MGRDTLDGVEHRNFSWNGPQWVSLSEEGKDVGFTDNYLVAKKWCSKGRNRFWSFCPKIYLEGKGLKYYA